ncbi:uncharacterized protein METZ01_LOCUS507881 [marine metagenome]|uniref:Putative auto-transporter adhesin head GIN domain-containing protein n=1 Tax=marine metagenome TaxID=408172 RepID=A0A383EDX0_9ZZZZ
MNKIFSLVIFIFMVPFLYAESEETDKINGSGVSMVETRVDSNYSALDINIAFDQIIVHCGLGDSTKIVGDDNIVPHIITKVKDDVLYISSVQEFETKTESVLTIHIQTLDTLSFKGVGEITVDKLDNQMFYCDFMGVGSCTLSGKVNNFTMNMNGVGSVNAKELIANIVDANVNGVGSAEVYAIDSLYAAVNGIGGLTYYGNPKKKEISNSFLGGITKGK